MKRIVLRLLVTVSILLVAATLSVVTSIEVKANRNNGLRVISADGKVMNSLFDGVDATQWGRKVAIAAERNDFSLVTGVPDRKRSQCSNAALMGKPNANGIPYGGVLRLTQGDQCFNDHSCAGSYQNFQSAADCASVCPVQGPYFDPGMFCNSGWTEQDSPCPLGDGSTICCVNYNGCDSGDQNCWP